jgi:type II secretory ATPase GspE/PulE/Tfp pilus assembly ATPase PilB-like protein
MSLARLQCHEALAALALARSRLGQRAMDPQVGAETEIAVETVTRPRQTGHAPALPSAGASPPGSARPSPRLDYLRAQRWVSDRDFDTALAAARQVGEDVESVLIERFRVPKHKIGAALSHFYRCPFVEYDDRFPVDPALMKDLKPEYLRRNGWVPLHRDGDAVTVLVDDPRDLQKVDSIERALQHQKVRLALALRQDILQYLSVATGETVIDDTFHHIVGNMRPEHTVAGDDDMVEVDENDSAIVRLANQMISSAVRARASDIHIEPYGARRDTLIRFRIDGSCVEYQKLPGAFRRPLTARIKIMARLDIAERRKPQDGKIKYRLHDREIELRVVTIPTVGGDEDVVMRILSGSESIPIDQLGMAARNLREIKRLAEKPHGLILCVGPTGSGKTTTLHSVLGHINTPDRKIWTAEDPVEITQYGVRQLQVLPKIGLTFAAAMRSFLRADPDVIMVGEMRDAETAGVGIEASLTGHVVLSTLHTNSAVETVVRLLDLGLDPFNFADALLGVIAQRLVKRICLECKDHYHPSPAEFDEIAHAYGREELAALGIDHTPDLELARGKGCESCNHTGYYGRMAIHELLVASDEIKRLTQVRARPPEILQQAKREGMTTLLQDGVIKALDGLTDFRQVRAAAMR